MNRAVLIDPETELVLQDCYGGRGSRGPRSIATPGKTLNHWSYLSGDQIDVLLQPVVPFTHMLVPPRS